MRTVFCRGVLLVDASNAFNCLNTQDALHNIQILCPLLLIFLLTPIERIFHCLLMAVIFFSEGTTQGDPLALAYSVSVTFLIASLQDSHVKHVWFADDATAGGTLHGLRGW